MTDHQLAADTCTATATTRRVAAAAAAGRILALFSSFHPLPWARALGNSNIPQDAPPVAVVLSTIRDGLTTDRLAANSRSPPAGCGSRTPSELNTRGDRCAVKRAEHPSGPPLPGPAARPAKTSLADDQHCLDTNCTNTLSYCSQISLIRLSTNKQGGM